MDATAFNSRKMKWLNGLNEDGNVSSTSFRVAYAIADHLNRVVGCAWPTNARIARKVGLSSKSISRAVGQLETLGWLTVRRTRNSSNEYRLAWPATGRPSEQTDGDESEDRSVPAARQIRPKQRDENVPQSYLTNLPKTYSSGLGEGRRRRSAGDRGTFEQSIVDRVGPEAWELLGELQDLNPSLVDHLCELERAGGLTQAHIENAKLYVKQNHKPVR